MVCMMLFIFGDIRSMKRLVASILALLFVVGVLIVPAVHKAHCAESNGTHEAATCPICQLANTPVMATASQTPPIAGSIVLGDVVLHDSIVPSASVRGPTQARAPPV